MGSVALAVRVLVVSLLGAGVERAAAQQPEAEVLVSEAILAYEDHRYEVARRALLEALRLDPDNVPALYYLGLVHLAERQPGSAVPVLERARVRAPQDIAIQFQLGVAYFTLGDYDKAGPLLSAVFEREPRLNGLGYYVGFMRYRNARVPRGAAAAAEPDAVGGAAGDPQPLEPVDLLVRPQRLVAAAVLVVLIESGRPGGGLTDRA